MTPLEKMAEAYWNAFRDGFLRVGGDPSYPTWRQAKDPNTAAVKNETMRCMRHAVEVIRKEFDATKEGTPLFEDLFPGKPVRRSAARTANDEAMAKRLK